ncbi:phosphonate C-P lyase system protein PhnG [Sinorhizobium medicae]|uniref:phosphonate C-P lyase system protein PhnG n=1 Tax=Sinorhizobium medicae TaxID=110321 RepID=UPI000416B28A|nr:phosphonate C-P lyase system protein PhnG [Sinorhizobium medicae]MBO1961753.1 phosphonate C-P lyase system protein PhnG [Sinorhizobium medicae]MDX0452132.1 phosphonate C-P lyase system protein PhnG [Sinorhizobium medicae]PLU10809.1 phosphonate C-P lyase system protein PhnG [Sinorhizobium medicae]PLU31898.1 phosphonate C-P lyase system protein PhnG [Sinorhizobium medicae]PLU50120.1 phosphonate C-P lyase system protein PhnG [Sinorhizobium medicae]
MEAVTTEAARTGEDAQIIARRRESMRLLARATLGELSAAWGAIGSKPDVAPVRGPETGLVMVRGRMGGGGAPFNLGEATVSRATVRLATGEVGHGQLLGTDKERARFAAIFDALFQNDAYRAGVEALHEKIAARLDAEDRRKAEETAATRVDFFTMVRGED